MQVYDTANRLAQEIKDSEEFINYKMAKQTINLNEELEEKIKKVQDLYRELIENMEAKKYFDAELKFNVMLGDVNKIISESVRDLIK